MMKTALIAAAAIAFAAFGTTAADAKSSKKHGHNYSHAGKHAGKHANKHARKRGGYGYRPYGYRGWAPGGRYTPYLKPPSYNTSWFNYAWYPRCRYVPQRVRAKAWNYRGQPYYTWKWKNVRVCV